jgi:hypothetical protein
MAESIPWQNMARYRPTIEIHAKEPKHRGRPYEPKKAPFLGGVYHELKTRPDLKPAINKELATWDGAMRYANKHKQRLVQLDDVDNDGIMDVVIGYDRNRNGEIDDNEVTHFNGLHLKKSNLPIEQRYLADKNLNPEAFKEYNITPAKYVQDMYGMDWNAKGKVTYDEHVDDFVKNLRQKGYRVSKPRDKSPYDLWRDQIFIPVYNTLLQNAPMEPQIAAKNHPKFKLIVLCPKIFGILIKNPIERVFLADPSIAGDKEKIKSKEFKEEIHRIVMSRIYNIRRAWDECLIMIQKAWHHYFDSNPPAVELDAIHATYNARIEEKNHSKTVRENIYHYATVENITPEQWKAGYNPRKWVERPPETRISEEDARYFAEAEENAERVPEGYNEHFNEPSKVRRMHLIHEQGVPEVVQAEINRKTNLHQSTLNDNIRLYRSPEERQYDQAHAMLNQRREDVRRYRPNAHPNSAAHTGPHTEDESTEALFGSDQDFHEDPQLVKTVETGGTTPIFQIEEQMLDGVSIVESKPEFIILSPRGAHQLYKKMFTGKIKVAQVGKYETKNNIPILVAIQQPKDRFGYINWGYYVGFYYVLGFRDEHIERLYDTEANYSKVPYGYMENKHWANYYDIANLKGKQKELAKHWVKLMTK